MGHSRNSRVRIKAARRGIEALKLREKGLHYLQIAEQMGISEGHAWKLVSREFDRLNARRTEAATDVLRLELARLDEMFAAVYERARAGDLKAIGAALKIVDQRADLLGLKSIRHEVKVSNEQTVNIVARIDQYAADLDRQMEARPVALPSCPESDDSRESLDQASTDGDAIPVPGV